MLTPGIGFRAEKFIVINSTQIVFCKLNGRVSVLFNKLLHSNAYLSNRFFCRIFRIKLINRFSLIRDGRRRALNVLIFLKVRSRWLPIGTGEIKVMMERWRIINHLQYRRSVKTSKRKDLRLPSSYLALIIKVRAVEIVFLHFKFTSLGLFNFKPKISSILMSH